MLFLLHAHAGIRIWLNDEAGPAAAAVARAAPRAYTSPGRRLRAARAGRPGVYAERFDLRPVERRSLLRAPEAEKTVSLASEMVLFVLKAPLGAAPRSSF